MTALAGATEFEGKPYWHRSIYLDTQEWDPHEVGSSSPNHYRSPDVVRRAFPIFDRWDSARKTGALSWDTDESTFGALPDDMPLYRDLNRKIETFLTRTNAAALGPWNFYITAASC